MRPTAVLATALFLAPAFAHADTIYNYAGTMYVNGISDVLHPDGTEDDTSYKNSPFQVAVAVDLTTDMYQITSPDFHDFADNFYSYLNFPNVGSDSNNVEEVDYNDNTPDGDFDPAPTISLGGNAQSSSCQYPPHSDCDLYYVSYGGTLPLVTSTPELSTFALLATGLAGVPVALRKRFV